MTITLYFYIGFFFSLFIKLINDFLPYPKDMKEIDQTVPQEYSGKQLVLLGLFWPLYVGLFILLLVRNSIKKGNKTK
jgi:hypothetical protein